MLNFSPLSAEKETASVLGDNEASVEVTKVNFSDFWSTAERTLASIYIDYII